MDEAGKEGNSHVEMGASLHGKASESAEYPCSAGVRAWMKPGKKPTAMYRLEQVYMAKQANHRDIHAWRKSKHG